MDAVDQQFSKLSYCRMLNTSSYSRSKAGAECCLFSAPSIQRS